MSKNRIFEVFKNKDKQEEFYLARDVMKAFWYLKWERFFWVINRAKQECIKKWFNPDKFFIELEPISTWWRPKKNFKLTRYACYLIAMKWDSKKQEIQNAREYFGVVKNYKTRNNKKHVEDCIKTKKEDKNTKINSKINIKIKNLFIYFFLLILVFVIPYILLNKIDFQIIKQEEKVNKQELWIDNNSNNNKEWLPKVDKLIKEEENKDKENQKIDIDSLNTISLEDKIKHLYLNKAIKDNYKESFENNYRDNFTAKLFWKDLIKSFFIFWNNKLYKQSCSLFSINKCSVNNLYKWDSFSNYWEKTKEGYNLSYIKEIEDLSNNGEKIYCTKISYKLKYDLNPNSIEEVVQYRTIIRDDWTEEIVSRVCESIKKWDRNLKCPIKAKTLYCSE